MLVSMAFGFLEMRVRRGSSLIVKGNINVFRIWEFMLISCQFNASNFPQWFYRNNLKGYPPFLKRNT